MNLKITFSIIILLLYTAAQASPWQRGADSRTAVPEKIKGKSLDWGLDAGLGYSQFAGNVEQTSANSEITYYNKIEDDLFYWQTGLIYGTSKGINNQNQGRTAFRYDWRCESQFKWFAFNTHAFNKFLKLNYRGTLGAGPWYNFIGDNWVNGVSIAPTIFYEDFDGFGIEKETWLSFRNFLEFKLSVGNTIGTDFFYMVRTNDTADRLIYFQPYLETSILTDKLSLKLSAIIEDDSRPKPGVKSTDYNTYVTLKLKFGE